LTDEEFIDQMDIDPSASRFALDVRRAVAELCAVDPCLIRPSDSTEDLRRAISRRHCVDWDYAELVFMLEDDYGHTLPANVLPPPFGMRRFFFWRPPTLTLGEWIEKASRVFRVNA